MSTAAVLTVSDSSAQGTRADASGPAVAVFLKEKGFTIVQQRVVPDELPMIEAALLEMCVVARLVVTTGGTGVAPRDVTPEATAAVCERLIPGLPELMRAEGSKKTPRAVLSRGVCGSRGQTLILNLPGSPKGAMESLEVVFHLVPHILDLLAGKTTH